MSNDKQKADLLWNPEDVDFIFRSYQIFERKFLDILKIIPLTKENNKSWSPELVNLFLDTSGLLDSISRRIIGKGRDVDCKIKIKGREKEIKTKNLNVEDFEVNLFSDLNLLKSRVVVYTYPIQILVPYKKYRDKDCGWWIIYNNLKHNRIENYSKANLRNTLMALASLFLFLIRYKEEEFSKAIYRLNFIKTSLVPEFFHRERTRENLSLFWYDSKLFGTPEKYENIPSDSAEDISSASGSEKFHKFVGRFN